MSSADDEPGYEQARTELREIVAKLETGGQSLEESLALWERGEQLAEICQRWLDVAGARLESAIAAHDADPGDHDDREDQ
jgi:exodeoxyribonuclease VII small subunit